MEFNISKTGIDKQFAICYNTFEQLNDCSNVIMIKEADMEEKERIVPDEEALYELADFFKIFADSTRVRILFALDGRELCVTDISEELGISVSCVSHQLKILRSSNVIRSVRRGKNVYYSLVDCHIHEIIDMALTHIEE